MIKSPKQIIAACGIAAGLALGGAAVAGASSGYDGARVLLRSDLVGSTPAPDGPTLFGVTPGTSPWVSRPGSVRLSSDGQIDITVRRLVIPTAPANSTNPVPQLSASIVCNGAVVASTASVPFDIRGNAKIETNVSLPSPCLAPAVLIHPNTATGVYIAANG